MVQVKLKASHPAEYVKVSTGERDIRVTKRGVEVSEDEVKFFTGDSLIVDGRQSKKKSKSSSKETDKKKFFSSKKKETKEES